MRSPRKSTPACRVVTLPVHIWRAGFSAFPVELGWMHDTLSYCRLTPLPVT